MIHLLVRTILVLIVVCIMLRWLWLLENARGAPAATEANSIFKSGFSAEQPMLLLPRPRPRAGRSIGVLGLSAAVIEAYVDLCWGSLQVGNGVRGEGGEPTYYSDASDQFWWDGERSGETNEEGRLPQSERPQCSAAMTQRGRFPPAPQGQPAAVALNTEKWQHLRCD